MAGSLADGDVAGMLASDGFAVHDPAGTGGILFHHRRSLDRGELLFLVNTSLTEHAAGTLDMAGTTARELDCVSGVIRPYPAEASGGGLRISFDLPPAGSLLLFADSRASKEPESPKRHTVGRPVKPEGDIDITRLSPNVLTLDYCDLRVKGETERNVYFHPAAVSAFRHNGLDGNPWSRAVQYKSEILDRDSFPADAGFEADFSFTVRGVPLMTEFRLAVERPERWEVSVNGETVRPDDGSWWLDRSFGVYRIGPSVRDGKNTVTLKTAGMSVHSELEPVLPARGLRAAGGGRGLGTRPA